MRGKGNVISLAKQVGSPRWWDDSAVEIQWSARRYAGLPVLLVKGTILLWSKADEQHTVEAGTISVAKPFLWAGCDPYLAMDEVSSDLELLAGAVLTDGGYSDEFEDWCLAELSFSPLADPIFIHDINIKPGYREPRQPLAAQAVMEAAAAFGSAASPIVGFGTGMISEDRRAECRDAGLWDWTAALGAKQWHGALVAVRPRE